MIKSLIAWVNSYLKEPTPEPFEPNKKGYDPFVLGKIAKYSLEIQTFYARKVKLYLLIACLATTPLLYLIFTSPSSTSANHSSPVILNFEE